MHSTRFVWQPATLDPVTGLGVLVLPNRWDDDDLERPLSYPLQVDPESGSFLGEIGEEYAVLIEAAGHHRLGVAAGRSCRYAELFVAGVTDCCDSTMTRLDG